MRGAVLVLVVGDGDERGGYVAVMMVYTIHEQCPSTSLLSTTSLRPILRRMTLLYMSLSAERCGCFLFSRSLSYGSRVAKPKLHCTSNINSLLLLPPRALCSSSFPSFTKTKNVQRQEQQQQQYSCSSKALQATIGTQSTENNAVASTSSRWNLPTVRQKFIDYFVRLRDHKEVPSSPIAPVNDPTLLFTNSGMNQFKPIFLDRADPKTPLGTLRRAVNSQKCIRAGGKHNDLDDVGLDLYHHTFFEMLGTWSFGDYFKTEAIEWAWDLLTSEEHFGLPADRFYATYFGGDEKLGLPPDVDVRNLWLRFLPEDRILPGTCKDNFWEMGNSGPCGPCSELHFDMIGNGQNVRHLVNADTPDVVEIWNLVFMQYNRKEESSGGELVTLPRCHVDTGMGLERLTSILQQTSCSYDTDVFYSLFKSIHQEVKGVGYEGRVGAEDTNLKDTAYRIVADHARALTFAITDGVIPSNEGRGYVLRRILRRAVRYGHEILGAPPGFFSRLVPVVVNTFGDDFPELRKRSDNTISLVREEEESFSRMLDRGIRYFTEAAGAQKAEGLNHLTGKQAFFLYDSMGFPFDLTEIMGKEMGLVVERQGFDAEMKIQKDRSRQVAADARRGASGVTHELGPNEILWFREAGIPCTDDAVKYDPHLPPHGTKVCGILANNKLVRTLPEGCEEFGLIVMSTPFYAEAGGQVSDIGVVKVQVSGNSADVNNNILEGTAAALDNMDDVMVADVFDVRAYAGYVLHCCRLRNAYATSPLKVGCDASLEVNTKHRFCVAPNHTMTHVLNAALRDVLGAGVEQKGSLVSHDRLRFDFSYSKAVPLHLLKRIEELVQRSISEARPVFTTSMSLSEAKQIPGLRTVFGEEYPDPVRVISIGSPPSDLVSRGVGEELDAHHFDISSSVELCGGTHINNISEAVAFTILEETAVAKGIRRITAVTGHTATTSLLQGQLMTSELETLESGVEIMESSSGSLDTTNLEVRKLEETDPNVLRQK